VNVLTPQERSTVVTLLKNKVSQHEISRKTGIDRKTIRKLAQAMFAGEAPASNSPMATGSPGLADQIPPPWPPAPVGPKAPDLPAHARSACEPYRAVDLWWGKEGPGLARLVNLRVLAIDPAQTAALAALAERGMDLQCTIQDGHVWLTDGPETVLIEPRRIKEG
jgi:hypothetical protein